jgi:hypothetical protein
LRTSGAAAPPVFGVTELGPGDGFPVDEFISRGRSSETTVDYVEWKLTVVGVSDSRSSGVLLAVPERVDGARDSEWLIRGIPC